MICACSDDENAGTARQNVTPQQPDSGKTDPDTGKTDPDTGKTDPDTGKTEPDLNSTEFALKYNAERLLPIRFILKLKQSLDIPIDRSSLAEAVRFDEATVKAVADLQEQWFGSSRGGRIDAETLTRIEAERFDEEGLRGLIGPHTTPDDVLIDGLQPGSDEVTEDVYLRCQDIIEQYGGYFDTTPGMRNMLAIRGAMTDGDKLRRTQTAKLYIDNIGSDNPAEQTTVHFASGADLNPASGNAVPFDDTMLTIWKEEADGSTRYFVHVDPLNVDPGMLGGNTGGYLFDGTAHLRDGQYIGIINRHSTSGFNHAHAVLQACHDSTDAFDMLMPEIRENGTYKAIPYEDLESLLAQTELSRVRYTGVNNVYGKHTYNGQTIPASGTTEVIRDFRTSNDKSDGILHDDEWNLARKVLANLYPDDDALRMTYPNLSLNEALDKWFEDAFIPYTDDECRLLFDTPADEIYRKDNRELRAGLFRNAYIRFHDSDADIAINIHTSPDFETSSQGCLNIPISSYVGYLQVLSANPNQSHYLYTLVDASKIPAL